MANYENILMDAESAKAITDKVKSERDAENQKTKVEPFITAMLKTIAEEMPMYLKYGINTLQVDIDTTPLSYCYSKSEAYELLAEALVNLGYECKPTYSYSKIRIFW